MFNRNSCFAFVAGLALLGHAVVAQAELPDFTPLVESASPAVVNISTKQKVAMLKRATETREKLIKAVQEGTSNINITLDTLFVVLSCSLVEPTLCTQAVAVATIPPAPARLPRRRLGREWACFARHSLPGRSRASFCVGEDLCHDDLLNDTRGRFN